MTDRQSKLYQQALDFIEARYSKRQPEPNGLEVKTYLASAEGISPNDADITVVIENLPFRPQRRREPGQRTQSQVDLRPIAVYMQKLRDLVHQLLAMDAARCIHHRRGQHEFRQNLLYLYGQRCAVTGCTVTSVLEAAHIQPHSKGGIMHESNGILLRSDIHTLFDLDLLGINPNGPKGPIVELHRFVQHEPYMQYNGKALMLPGVSKEALKDRYNKMFLEVKRELTEDWRAVS